MRSINSIGKIRKYSCKYAEICELVMKSDGINFVYGEYVEGSGLIVLCMCLEALGFVMFDESHSVFVSKNNKMSFCSERDEKKEIRSDFAGSDDGHSPRYVFLNRDTTVNQFTTMMELLNSKENCNGSFIKVIISSRVGRDGINLSNVQNIHLVAPEWNQSTMYQAISRGIRVSSHYDLLQLRDKVQVRIYRHVAVPLKGKSIDQIMYAISKDKDVKIKRIMRFMKQCAVGCRITKNRNIRPGTDESSECDYLSCKYDCVCEKSLVPRDRNFILTYNEDCIKKFQWDILMNIYRNNTISLEEIYLQFPQMSKFEIIYYLEKILTSKTLFLDKYGYVSYICNYQRLIYLNRFLNKDEKMNSTLYSNSIICISKNKLTIPSVEHTVDNEQYFKMSITEVFRNLKKIPQNPS